MDEPTRACRTCKRVLPFSSFYRNSSAKSGYRGDCKACKLKGDSARYHANRDARRAQQAIYRADPEHRRIDRERTAQWRAEHPEWARATVNAYAARPENRERQRQYGRAYRVANRARRRENDHRRNALKRNGAAARIPMDLLVGKLAYWGSRCWIAGPHCTVEPEQWDHVKPLSKGGAHLLANLRPACARCNLEKRGRWPYPISGSWLPSHRPNVSTG